MSKSNLKQYNMPPKKDAAHVSPWEQHPDVMWTVEISGTKVFGSINGNDAYDVFRMWEVKACNDEHALSYGRYVALLRNGIITDHFNTKHAHVEVCRAR